MIDKLIKVETEVSFEDVGFHNVTFDLTTIALEQYVNSAGSPIYRALISDKEFRRGNRELCGMKTCSCGSGLNPMGPSTPDEIELLGNSARGAWWVEVNPEDVSDWEGLFRGRINA